TTVAEEHEHEVLESWQKALDAVRTGDRSWAATHLDWANKERLFSQVVQRHGIGLDDPAVQRLALAYHDIDPAHSICQTPQRRRPGARRRSRRGLDHTAPDPARRDAGAGPGPLRDLRARGRLPARRDPGHRRDRNLRGRSACLRAPPVPARTLVPAPRPRGTRSERPPR